MGWGVTEAVPAGGNLANDLSCIFRCAWFHSGLELCIVFNERALK